jgi:hypothetical protein
MKYELSWWQHETKQRNTNNVKSHTRAPDRITIKIKYGAGMAQRNNVREIYVMMTM